MDSGQAFAKLLPSPSPDYIYVFGAVYVKATPQDYMRYAADAEFLRKLPQYQALGRFSAAPEKDEMRGFDLEPDDIKELRRCKPGTCEVQLPDFAFSKFTQGIDWKRSDVAQQVSVRTRQLAADIFAALPTRRFAGSWVPITMKGSQVEYRATFADLLRLPLSPSVSYRSCRGILLGLSAGEPAGCRVAFIGTHVSFGLKPHAAHQPLRSLSIPHAYFRCRGDRR